MNKVNQILDKYENDTIEAGFALQTNTRSKSIQKLSDELSVSKGTILRWIVNDSVPNQYQFQLMKLLDIPIDYSQYSSTEKDQFYTPVETAKKCLDIFRNKLQELSIDETKYTYIESSAGSGNFLNVLPTDRIIALDIEPKSDGIIQQDFLDWTPSEGDRGPFIVFGNPPFGLRGNLALQFINHSYNFADFVGYILPQLFESDGKGVPRKRVKGFNLIHSEKIPSVFYNPSGQIIQVHTVFQIWSKYYTNKVYNTIDYCENTTGISVYSLSDGKTPSSIRNKKMFYKCDIYIPSTCFGVDNMKYYNSFNELPGHRGYGVVFNKNKKQYIRKFKHIDWSKVAFKSTNSAYNIRRSQIIQAIL